jgi:hypothetical protein
MFRKIAFSLATAAALGTVALAPTSASAFGGHFGGGHWGGRGFGWGGVGIGLGLAAGAVAASACVRQTVIYTPAGPVVRWINVCY